MDKPRLIDQTRNVMRLFHYSIRTEETYIQWIKRFIFFHNKRHPKEMGEKEVRSFLTHLVLLLISMSQHPLRIKPYLQFCFCISAFSRLSSNGSMM